MFFRRASQVELLKAAVDDAIIELGISILNLKFGGCMGSQLSSMVR